MRGLKKTSLGTTLVEEREAARNKAKA